MFEAEKTNQVRGQVFFDTYMSGRVIDIGSGNDLVVPHAEPFDLDQGNANLIDEVLEVESYDCVHSSHCLEHMHDPVDALRRWWKLVKSGGYLVVVVPDENLYEQGAWPSRFNPDHKATFRMNKEDTWSPCSYDLAKLAGDLPNGEVISAELQDQGYDYDLMRLEPETTGAASLRILLLSLFNHLLERNLLTLPLAAEINRFFHAFGAIVDQTYGPALAQLQVVVRKNPAQGEAKK